ncbi:MAG: S-adenosylmethionine:tRNA ribosyltransferase-isomerase [Micromonosporaceae bacterium]|nr:S-adenosylmethionine:tRNA ribosyltransferase-isomerase [Micromonosporaceae bacterium]
MTAPAGTVLPAGRAAHEPPEARGLARDAVRLLVGTPGGVSHHRFTDLPELLAAGDLLVVNRSATLPAAVDVVDVIGGPPAGTDLVVHVSTSRPDRSWLVELRIRRDRGATEPYPGGAAGDRLRLPGGASLRLRARHPGGRLWVADLDVGSVPSYLLAYGRPIRYGYVERDWPLSAYQTVFGTQPGSAEMPSAGRPFTAELVTRLVTAGVGFAPVTLHTGVASLESPEPPYPEWYEVPPTTARLVNQTRAAGGRVIAVGTTATRAVETVAAPDGSVRAGAGWTELVITPRRGVRAADGLLTGFHEPRSSHLDLLSAVAGEALLASCYAAAVSEGYRWHEFGDLNLLLP